MEGKKSKKTLLLGLATLFCLIMTIVFFIRMNNQEVDYEIVKVMVVSSETKHVRVNNKYSYDKYEIVVSYNGQNYELENAHDSYSYRKGSTIDAYLSGGKLYANVEGVNTSTWTAKIYFGFLIGTFIMLFVWLCSFGKKKQ